MGLCGITCLACNIFLEGSTSDNTADHALDGLILYMRVCAARVFIQPPSLRTGVTPTAFNADVNMNL